MNPYSDTPARMLAQVRPDIGKFTSSVIDHLSENAALMVTDLGYSTGSVAAKKLVKTDVANNPSVFLPENHAGKIIPLRQLSGDAADAAEQVFATLRSGVQSPGAKAP